MANRITRPGARVIRPRRRFRWPIGIAISSIASTAGRALLGARHLRCHPGESYEVVSCGAFGQGTLWSNETTVYLSAVAYLVGGGYALAHRRHVRIDLIYERLSPRARASLDLFTFIFFLVYAGALIWVGTTMGGTSFQQGEGTGTPWNPPIWPVKLAIPVAALLLLLQGIANLLRDTGVARRESRAS